MKQSEGTVQRHADFVRWHKAHGVLRLELMAGHGVTVSMICPCGLRWQSVLTDYHRYPRASSYLAENPLGRVGVE